MKPSLIPVLLAILVSCQQKIDLDAGILDGEDTAVCWMTPLADDTPLTCLSIPGAHDAASATITAFRRWTRTQELDIAGLWNCGVRAFDLRPAWVDGSMGLYHDKYSAHVGFRAVMDALILALDRHPGEGAIVIIRHEEEADRNAPEWASELGSILDGLRPRLASWSQDMTLGDLRGKILVLSRNAYAGGPIGGYLLGWTSSADASAQRSARVTDEAGGEHPFWVQDYYHPDGADDKWEEIRDMLDASANAEEPRPLVVNHASGYLGKLPDYRGNARNVNAKTAEYIKDLGGPAGIVMMDFAGIDRSVGTEVGGKKLVEAVIGRN
jgi:hypothetical protein